EGGKPGVLSIERNRRRSLAAGDSQVVRPRSQAIDHKLSVLHATGSSVVQQNISVGEVRGHPKRGAKGLEGHDHCRLSTGAPESSRSYFFLIAIGRDAYAVLPGLQAKFTSGRGALLIVQADGS